jgi:hypothetical protein
MTAGSCEDCGKHSVVTLKGKGYCKACYLRRVNGEKKEEKSKSPPSS